MGIKTITREAGRARLAVATTGGRTDEGREIWSWSVSEGDTLLGHGSDLHTGVGHTATPAEMLASLCNFLTAAAESANYAMRTGTALSETENGDLFSHNVVMLACQESDEIAMLGTELEEGEN